MDFFGAAGGYYNEKCRFFEKMPLCIGFLKNFDDMTSVVVKPLFVLLGQDAPSSIDCLFNGVFVVRLTALRGNSNSATMPMLAAGMEGK